MVVRRRRAVIAFAATLALTGGCTSATRGNTVDPVAAQAPAPTSSASATASAPKPRVTRSAAVDAARSGLRRHETEIKSAPGEKYQAVGAVVDDSGEQHVRFQRSHDGLPVLGGDFVVHSAADGSFRDATVAQEQPIDVPSSARVSRADAIGAAGLEGRVEARKVVDALAGKPALAWEITSPTRVVLVDATTGRVRLAYDTVDAADKGTGHGLQVGDVEIDTTPLPGGGYTLVDPERGDTTVRDALNTYYFGSDVKFAEFTDPDNEWGDGARADRATGAVDVHYGLAKSWDYLRDTFGRRGVADDGKGLIAYVHHDVDDNNAMYVRTCKCLYFGDGSAGRAPYTSLDVVGHEMAHGLTAATAALVGTGESAALNESTSDIFGTLVEFSVDNPVDAPDYTISEKTRLDGTPSRWMDEPNRDGKSVSCWTPAAKDLDEHYSSGIGNKFFYNLAVGSAASRWGESTPCGGAAPVTGIGNEKAAQIWYRALTVYMVSNTNFAGAREATLRAAVDLYGADSTERGTVDAAWRAVGVDAAQAPNAAPVIAPLPYFVTVPKAGDPVRLQVTAREPQGQPVTYRATGLPEGVSIDAAGLITGAPATRGLFKAEITATDPDGNSDTKSTEFVVKGPVFVESAYPRVITRLSPYTTIDFKATFNDGKDQWVDKYDTMKVTATGFPETMLLSVRTTDIGVWQATITGRPKSVGSGTALLTATDADGNQATASIPWEVLPADRLAEPSGVSVTGGNGTAQVGWDQLYTDPFKFPVTGYVVRVSPGAETRLDATARSLTLTGLDVRRAYTVGVRAVSVAGDGAEKTVTLTPTGLPMSASPATVVHGKTSALSGRVLRNNSATVAGATVTIEQRPAGKTSWSRYATVKTDGKGVWRATVKPGVTTAYRVTYPGSSGMWPATSGATGLWIRYAVTAKASTAKPRANKKIKISGTARPARAGAKVTLQYKKGSRWITITSTKTGKTGAYTFSRAFRRGAWTLRVVVAPDSYNVTGTSGTVKLKVT
ncbi:hypothetical protein Aph02nite_58290 [Actinoplanes philippinensis]|uniref:Zn-dependent metalloprotease n=1 Tax=Actinoplanes philippinensis TaxID=35752 RepID=A0A1I2JD38_9ACTN|nr:M4 family metallopeptidase [Actinoplanes philippinensis]GIE79879.1 hypothetical protein Aph02nite_58290 [Actinoplanes philippinensis]SFF51900.1 Zn-dependent metalloprotease [Actinoplanes philippinensis]